MKVLTISRLSVSVFLGSLGFLVLLFPGRSDAAFMEVGVDFFGSPAIVGIDNIVPGQSALIGFDLTPSGAAIATPFGVPGASAAFVSSPLTSVFEPVGVRLGANDVAISQPANPPGAGVVSSPNALASQATVSFNSSTDIEFIGGPTSAVGVWVTDGPTNEVSIEFFDINNNLIASLSSLETFVFLGIASDEGIRRVSIATSGSDDYFIDNLHYVPSVPLPASALLFGSAILALFGVHRRKTLSSESNKVIREKRMGSDQGKYLIKEHNES